MKQVRGVTQSMKHCAACEYTMLETVAAICEDATIDAVSIVALGLDIDQSSENIELRRVSCRS